jgi:type II secretory pathway pseudopilin PulG
MERRLKRSKKRTGGFTLFEFVVAMAMLAIITPALTLAFTTVISAGGRIDRTSETTSEARAVLSVITRDLENAYLPVPSATAQATTDTTDTQTTTAPKGWLIATDSASGNAPADSISLTTFSGRPSLSVLSQNLTPADTPEKMSVYQQVNYSLQPGLNADAGVLVRDTASPPGEDSTSATDEEALSDQVLGLNFEYFDGTTWTDTWDTTQPTTDTTGTTDTTATDTTTTPPPLPMMIRLTLVLASQDGPRTYTTTVSLPMYNSSLSKIEPDPSQNNGGATTAGTTGSTGSTTGGSTGGTGGTTGRGMTTTGGTTGGAR